MDSLVPPVPLQPVPTIVVVNRATTPLGYGLDQLVAAGQKYVDQYLNPTWGVRANVVASDPANPIPLEFWTLTFLDTADVAGAEGYHEVDPTASPDGKIFVKTTLEAGDDVAVTFTHELAEILVDPYTTQTVTRIDNGDIYSLEVADAVEESDFVIDGIPCSNIVTPAWFQIYPAGPYDLLGHLNAPWALETGGYVSILRGGQPMELFGSRHKAARFAKEDRRGHRTTKWKNRQGK